MIIKETINKDVILKGTKNPNDTTLKSVPAPLPNWSHFASLIIGGPGSGKTSLMIRLITKYYKKKFNSIYLFSGSLKTLPEEFLDRLNENKIFSSLNKLERVIDIIRDRNDKTLIIIDDLVADLQDKQIKKVLMNFIYNRRHIGGGSSLMVISQKLRKIDLSIRIGFDTCYFFSINNKRELEALYGDFVEDLSEEEFFALVKYIKENNTIEDHPFMFLDKRNSKYYNKFNLLTISKNGNVG
jgi:hypothetical protein